MHRRSSRKLPTRAIALALALAAGCSAEAPPPEAEIPVRVDTVAIIGDSAPVVLLEEVDGKRVLPIWIGTPEATSIVNQINETPPLRPNTHDLARQLIDSLNASVERVVVTSLRGGTYYGVLHLRASGRHIEIDVRPSDGIAIALRTGAPILVRASVFDSAGEALDAAAPGRPIGWRKPVRSCPATPPLTL